MNRLLLIFYSLCILTNIQCKQRESQGKMSSQSKASTTPLSFKTPEDKAQAMANAASKILAACEEGNVSDTTKQVCKAVDTFTDLKVVEGLLKDSEFKSALNDAQDIVSSSTSTNTATSTSVALGLDDSTAFLIAGVALISVGAIATIAGLAGWREFSHTTKQNKLNEWAVTTINRTRADLALNVDDLFKKYKITRTPEILINDIKSNKFGDLSNAHPLVQMKVIDEINKIIKDYTPKPSFKDLQNLFSFNETALIKAGNLEPIAQMLNDKNLASILKIFYDNVSEFNIANDNNIKSYLDIDARLKGPWKEVNFTAFGEAKLPTPKNTNFQKFSTLGKGKVTKLTAAAGIIGILGGVVLTIVGTTFGLTEGNDNNGNNPNNDSAALLEFVNSMSQIAQTFQDKK